MVGGLRLRQEGQRSLPALGRAGAGRGQAGEWGSSLVETSRQACGVV